MKRRPSSAWLLLALAIAMVGLCGARQSALVHQRAAAGLRTDVALTDSSPMLTFTTIILGGFRGLLADVLWMRATRLQEEGRYVELVQLADWITQLEPHATGIWAFHAWNMAYNVSVMMADPDERWQWVQNGIRLLRDSGLRLNPREARLYFELGWLFQHKIGSASDPAHAHYQRRLAQQVERALPEGRLPVEPLAADDPRGPALQRELGLLPARMQELESACGPLDWRVPEAFSLYWSHLGLSAGKESRWLCVRMQCQSLAALVFTGTTTNAAGTGPLPRAPRPALIDSTVAAYERALAEAEWPGAAESYARFLPEASALLDARGDRAAADRLRRRAAALAVSPE